MPRDDELVRRSLDLQKLALRTGGQLFLTASHMAREVTLFALLLISAPGSWSIRCRCS